MLILLAHNWSVFAYVMVIHFSLLFVPFLLSLSGRRIIGQKSVVAAAKKRKRQHRRSLMDIVDGEGKASPRIHDDEHNSHK